MKKKFTYIGLVVLFISACAFVAFNYKSKLKNEYNAFYPLQERKGANALLPEWTFTKTRATDLIKNVRENPQDTKSRLALASLYLQEARVTGDYAYYDKAALHYIDKVLEKTPDDFEALTLKSLIKLSQHHFSDALVIAEKAKKVVSYNAFVHGLLVDGNVEMGNYKEAIENADKMTAIRPDLRSYSRISYLREIHGDNTGAIEAMVMAVKAGGMGDEPTAWARIQLAKLYENVGDVAAAETQYKIILEQRPGYAYAYAGLGHIASANKNVDEALSYYLKADSLVNDYSFKEMLVKLYRAKGNSDKAETILKSMLSEMTTLAEKAKNDESVGHYADLELARAYLLANNTSKALEYALAEYNRRPDNIDVNEMLAWVYYKKGNSDKAMEHIRTALKTNCQNPTLLAHSGLIHAQNGDNQTAKTTLEHALKNNPNIDIELKNECLTKLHQLQ